MAVYLLNAGLDYSIDTARAESKFRIWHVEALLNSAADLLDRCIADRTAAFAYMAQAAISNHNVQNEREAVYLEGARKDTGYYEALVKEAQRRNSSSAVQVQHLQSAVDAAKTAHDRTDQGSIQYSTLAELHRSRSALEGAVLDQQLAADNLGQQQLEYDRKINSIAFKAKEMEGYNQLFEAGQCLDYAGLAEPILNRMDRDFSEAAEKLHVAALGMKAIYNYTEPYSFAYSVGDQPYPFKAIDASIEWARQAIRWLSAFAQNDQGFTVSISLKSLVDWPRFLAGELCQFSIPDDLFQGHTHVRLRGIALGHTKHEIGSQTVIGCRISVPSVAKVVFEREVASQIIDQRQMPHCTLGAVRYFGLGREPEVAGTVSLMNASPWGINSDAGLWSMKLLHAFGPPLSNDDDLILEIRLTGQPL